MAMIKCTECGREMSDKAASCPNCGCPIEEIIARLEEKKAFGNNNKKKGIIGVVVAIVVVLAIAGGVCAWYFGVKVPRDQAALAYQEYLNEVQVFNDAIKKYNDAIDQYNNKAKEVIAVNDTFDEAINRAQALVDCGDTPFEGAKLTNLSNSIKDARNNKVATPEIKEVDSSIQANIGLEQEKKEVIDAETANLSSGLTKYVDGASDVDAAREALTIPDYSSFVASMEELSKELEDSYTIQKQITAPTEEWVLTRLGRVENIANMAPVTEEHDPNGQLNKAGGYTSTVYFGTPLLETEYLTGYDLIEEGTSGGGAIETYKTEEEANKRNTYLATFDGMGYLSPGSHVVLGTMVIRTSDKLKASQQETITNAIIAAMTSLN